MLRKTSEELIMRKNSDAISWIIVGSVLFALALAFFFLLSGKETRVSETFENNSIMALECKIGAVSDSFYTSSIANTVQNDIKLTYKEKKIDKLFYTFTGVYRSDEVAAQDETTLHAKYNIYVGDHDVAMESLAPTYSVNKSKLILTLYADQYARINPVTAIFFFIDNDRIDGFEDYSIEEAKKYYETKGFVCTINE